MNPKTLSPQALSVIDQYLHFRLGAAVCSVPYFNNKTIRARAALRAYGGKGSPADIRDEIGAFTVKNHIAPAALADGSLKKLLVEQNIGIDCSALAYYVLDAESQARGTGTLARHISFVHSGGLVGKVRSALRPAENCDVATLSDDANSRTVPLGESQAGDFISLIGGGDDADRDHILVVHEVERRNKGGTDSFMPITIHYSHAVAYPEDGLYGSGIRQGTIEVNDASHILTDGRWTENGKEGGQDRILARAKRSKTEIRRLKWW